MWIVFKICVKILKFCYLVVPMFIFLKIIKWKILSYQTLRHYFLSLSSTQSFLNLTKFSCSESSRKSRSFGEETKLITESIYRAEICNCSSLYIQSVSINWATTNDSQSNKNWFFWAEKIALTSASGYNATLRT